MKEFAASVRRLVAGGQARDKLAAPPKSADELKFRLSGVGKICPRRDVMIFRDQVTARDSVSAHGGLAFAFGTAVHYMIQNIVLVDVLRGHWRCLGCGKVLTGHAGMSPISTWILRSEAMQMDCRCDKELAGHHPGYLFDEVAVEVSGVVGHPDGAIMIEDLVRVLKARGLTAKTLEKHALANPRMLVILEIKTMKQLWADAAFEDEDHPDALKLEPEDRKALADTLAEHRIQSNLYAVGAGPDVAGTVYLLVNKLFELPANTFKAAFWEKNESIVSMAMGVVDSVRSACREPSLPLPIGVCHTIYDRAAKYCPVAQACFSGRSGRDDHLPHYGTRPESGSDWIGDLLGEYDEIAPPQRGDRVLAADNGDVPGAG